MKKYVHILIEVLVTIFLVTISCYLFPFLAAKANQYLSDTFLYDYIFMEKAVSGITFGISCMLYIWVVKRSSNRVVSLAVIAISMAYLIIRQVKLMGGPYLMYSLIYCNIIIGIQICLICSILFHMIKKNKNHVQG